MVSPAPTPSALQPAARAFGVPGPHTAAAALQTAAPCDSCQSAPASFTLTWPDARFQLCSPCLPLATPAGSVLRAVAAGPASPVVVHDSLDLLRHHAAADRLDSAAARPSRRLVPVAVRRDVAPEPLSPSATEHAEREVLLAAAFTVLTSRPSLRGRRLSRDGGCDVVAALVLAAGGAVDQTGRPIEPTERPAAQLLRRVLRRVADQLAGCTVGRSWTGDPVALIDCWQAHPGLDRAARVAALRATAGPALQRGGPSSTASDAEAARAGHGGGGASHRRPVPTAPTAARECVSTGTRS